MQDQPYITSSYIQTRLHRDIGFRLFQQLHQDDEPDWYRANGSMCCALCGVQYRFHPIDPNCEVDHRLCNGTLVHL